MAMPRLCLYLLGPTRVEQDGVPIEVDTRKAIALLAYLSTTGKAQPREVLLGLFWPDVDANHAFNSLRRTISVLRSALAGDWLLVERETVALLHAPDVWSDVAQFHSLLAECRTHGHPSSAVCPACLPLLVQAAALHRGDFMSSFGLKDSPDFDDWQVQQGEVLRSERSDALERLAQGYAAQGDLESAITYARRELALDRLNESAHAQLMRLYAWSGRRSAALQQYQDCVKILQEQLGVSPQDSLVALHDAIRSGDVPQPPARAPMASKAAITASTRPLAARAGPMSAQPPSPSVTVLQERRVVTVLAAASGQAAPGVSGLTAEDEAALVQRFVRASEDILRRYDGHSVRSLGGSVLAVFGAARTRESDPELAIRAALEMQDEAGRLGLGFSAGISTGEVYAGRIDASAYEQPGLVGRAIDVALRLAEQAQPGQILVVESTYRATRRAFAFAPIETAAGALKPATIYQVEQLLPRPAKTRGLEDVRAILIGRDDELARLKGVLERVRQGQGQMVALIGEAGVGKSRLIAELKEYALAGGKPLLWLEGRCLEMGVPAGYVPFLDILGGYFAWPAHDDGPTRRAAIGSHLQALAEQGHLEPERVAEAAALLCHLLSIPMQDSWNQRLKDESAEQIRQRTFLALRDFVLALARQQPLVLVFEDLHWADSLSIDLISLLMQELCRVPLLLVCSYRPERDAATRDLAAIADQTCRDLYTELHLRELTQQQSRQVLESLLSTEALPAPLQDSVLDRAQGNPFYIEEIARSLLEDVDVYQEQDHWRARSDVDPTAIPDSVQSVILSRVDRLSDDARHILQTASVIGQLFRRRALEAASEPTTNLGGILAELADRALIYQERTFPEVEYSFKHVLTQQAVYQNIVRSRRAELHRRVAEAIETLYADNLADYAEQLAYHCEQGGKAEKAVEYLFSAGEKAKRQYANASAIALLTHALDLLKMLPDSSERARKELDLLLALGNPLTATKGYAAEETGRVYSRARALCLQLGDTTQLLPALHGLWRMQLSVRLDDALTLAKEFMALAEATHERGPLLEAHRALAGTLFPLGDLTAALAQAEQGLALYASGKFDGHAFLYGQDPALSLLGNAGWSLWSLGYPDQALERARRLLALGQESANPFDLVVALMHASGVHHMRRELQVVEEQARAMIEMGIEHNYPLALGDGLAQHGWAISWQGKADEGIAEIQRGRAILHSVGFVMFDWDRLDRLAEAYGQAGRFVEALSTVAEALDLVASTGGRHNEADTYRIKGEMLFRQGSATEAEACFQRAIAIARSQQAKGWELRAAISLACLWQELGKREEARSLLQGVYDWFTEGFDTADLKDAKALLDALAA